MTRAGRWPGIARWWSATVPGSRAVRCATWGGALLLWVLASWSFASALQAAGGGWSTWPVRLGLAVLLAAGQSVPLVWWRSRPFAAWLVLLVMDGAGRVCEVAAGLQAGQLSTPGQFAGVVVLFGAGVALPRWHAAGLAAATAAILLLTLPAQHVGVVLFVTATATLLGMSTAARYRAERDLERHRFAQSQLAERSRIARELHDVVAHHMSVVAVQAETARFRLPDTTGAQAEEFASIAATSRQALDEMRRLLGALRAEGEPEHTPQPTVHDLPELVESVRRTGSPVRVELDERLVDLPAVHALAVYRIVQEALSNVVKHAPRRPIDLAVTVVDGVVRIVVSNPAPEAAGPVMPGGFGIPGMRERAELLGGSLHAGPRSGNFEVWAEIPLAGGDR